MTRIPYKWLFLYLFKSRFYFLSSLTYKQTQWGGEKRVNWGLKYPSPRLDHCGIKTVPAKIHSLIDPTTWNRKNKIKNKTIVINFIIIIIGTYTYTCIYIWTHVRIFVCDLKISTWTEKGKLLMCFVVKYVLKPKWIV